MNNFIENILTNNENLYSENIKKELEHLDITSIKESDLSILNSTLTGEINLFFFLEYKLLIEKDSKKLAYLNYLISYYLFIILTPPFSQELAIKYSENAIELDSKNEYLSWLEYVKQGN